MFHMTSFLKDLFRCTYLKFKRKKNNVIFSPSYLNPNTNKEPLFMQFQIYLFSPGRERTLAEKLSICNFNCLCRLCVIHLIYGYCWHIIDMPFSNKLWIDIHLFNFIFYYKTFPLSYPRHNSIYKDPGPQVTNNILSTAVQSLYTWPYPPSPRILFLHFYLTNI